MSVLFKPTTVISMLLAPTPLEASHVPATTDILDPELRAQPETTVLMVTPPTEAVLLTLLVLLSTLASVVFVTLVSPETELSVPISTNAL
jgi:hypothetical protein